MCDDLQVLVSMQGLEPCNLRLVLGCDAAFTRDTCKMYHAGINLHISLGTFVHVVSRSTRTCSIFKVMGLMQAFGCHRGVILFEVLTIADRVAEAVSRGVCNCCKGSRVLLMRL